MSKPLSPEANNPNIAPPLSQEQLLEIAKVIALAQSQAAHSQSPATNGFLERLTKRMEQEEADKIAQHEEELALRKRMALEAKEKIENEKHMQRGCGHRKARGETALVGQKIGPMDDQMLFLCQRCQCRWIGPINGPYENEYEIPFDYVLRPEAERAGF